MIHTVLANRYEIVEQIGEGGMAIVYRAVDQVLKRNVAVKILKQQFNGDQEFIVNFGNEAQSAASLNHQNIVNIFDVGTEEINGQTLYYIVMECIEGVTLKELIDKEAPFVDARIAHISIQIAQALKAAHANRIIHRDIKPQNILINHEDDVKVTDFGIAKISTSSTITYTSSILGTVHYISPEQAKGKFIDEKSDIYSLGIAMYEMATGNVPFDGENAVAIAIRHIQDPLIPPIDLNPSLSKGLNQIIVKALEKDTSQRYASASDLLEDLKNYKTLHITEKSEIDHTTILTPIDREKIEEAQKAAVVEEEPVQKSVYQGTPRKNEEPDVERRDPFKRVILPILLAVLFVGGGFFFIRSMISPPPETGAATENSEVLMETFLGLKVQAATRRAEQLGLKLVQAGQSYSTEYAKDEIMEQSINPGNPVPPGTEVSVVISLGQEMVEVPPLLNISQQDAESALTRVGLSVGDQRNDFSDSYNEGMVMKQTPDARTLVPKGSSVSITISKGRKVEMIQMPDLRDESQYDAIRTLNDIDLKVGKIEPEHSDTVAEDYVIRQSIAPHSEVEPKTAIDLVISLGPKTEPATEPPATEAPQTEADVDYVIQVVPPSPQPEGATTYHVDIVRVEGTHTEDVLNESYQYQDGTQNIHLTDAPGLKFEIYIDGTFVKAVTQ